jgi:protease PrsW
MGILAIPVTILLYYIFPGSGLEADGTFLNALIISFYDAAFHEELAKYLVFIAGVYFMKDLDEWYDGILYGIMIGLGFGFIENIMYFSHLYEFHGVNLLIQRSFLSMPLHALIGGIMGYYLGKAKFSLDEDRIYLFHILSIAIPFAVHGLFNFTLLIGVIDLSFLAVFAVAFSWHKVFKLKTITHEKKIF